MKTVFTLVWKDVLLFSKDKAAVSLTFLVPVALIYIFGHVFGVNRGPGGPAHIPLAVADESGAPEIRALVAALKKEPTFKVIENARDGTEGAPLVALTEAAVRADIRSNRYRFAVVFPPDAMADAQFGLRMKFLYNPRNDIETQTVTGLLQKTIFTEAPAVLLQSLGKQATRALGAERAERFHDRLAHVIGDTFGQNPAAVRQSIEQGTILTPAGAAGAGGADLLDRVVKIEKEQLVGAEVKNQMATRSVGGWAVMFLMFSLSASAASLFEEKKAGLFLRLLSGPVSRGDVLWSKYLFCIGLGLVQLVALFFAGRLLFGIDVLGNFGSLLFACLSAAMACTAFGMLLASVARTPAAASGLATFLILTMSAMGGAWFPPSMMPEFMQVLGKFTLVYWAMEGFSAALWAGASLREMLPWCGVQLAIAAVIMAISLWRFRRGTIFE
ncbi:MAG TPA: ABC transporter permease [Opitutaceae bacterium]|nr:ABC transporter permease [Opitutaceae bacterium]